MQRTGDAAREAVGEGVLDATDAVLTADGGGDESRLHTVPAAQPARLAHSCTRISLTDATPIAPPEKPAQDKPWTPQTCLELADYYRGETLPQSSYKDAPYQRAVQAAISLVNKQQVTYSQVDAVFRYMCGRDETLKDTWWADKKVDLWHVAEHCSTKLREIERKSNPPTPISSHPSEWPSVLLSKEKQQRNLERLRALAASRTHYHPEPILCAGTA